MPILADEPGLAGAKRIAARLVSDSGVHALLLYGAPGAGQERVARALSKAWLCTNPGPDGACGVCQACTAFERGNNADYQLVKPYGAGHQIKQGAIVREPPTKKSEITFVPIRDFVRTGPLMSRLKVTVFHSADKMNASAANAFLKTLEEPQEYVRFVLVTDSVGRILPTILSRCLSVACEMPSDAERELLGSAYVIAPHFAERMTPETYDGFQKFVAQLAEASPVMALRLAEDLEELCEGLEMDEGTGRQAIADGLELLASLVSRTYPERSRWSQLILVAHRRVLGNVHAGRVLDALFTAMLA